MTIKNKVVFITILAIITIFTYFNKELEVSMPRVSTFLILGIIAIATFTAIIFSTQIREKVAQMVKTFDNIRGKYNKSTWDGKNGNRPGNFALGIFNYDDDIYYYAADSKITLNDTETAELKKKLLDERINIGSKTKLCVSKSITEEFCEIKRLNLTLDFYKPVILGYAKDKINCCERKIIAQLKKDFNLDELKKGSILIYTSLEPCIYCFELLKELIEDGIEVKLLYDELLLDKKEVLLNENIEVDQIISLFRKVGEF